MHYGFKMLFFVLDKKPGFPMSTLGCVLNQVLENLILVSLGLDFRVLILVSSGLDFRVLIHYCLGFVFRVLIPCFLRLRL